MKKAKEDKKTQNKLAPYPKKGMHSERTLIVIKPDGIQRSLIGEIIKRYERVGLKLVATKLIVPDEELIKNHYCSDPDWFRRAGEKSIEGAKRAGIEPMHHDPIFIGKKILDTLCHYMTSGPVLAMVWQGAHAVSIVRKLTGGTEPLSSDVGTIRGDFVLDSYALSNPIGRSVRNLVHASGTVQEAEKEIAMWFDQKEIVDYRLVQEKILYDVNLDGLLE